MQLVKQDTLAVTALTKELLGIYAIDPTTGDYTNTKVGAIDTATLEGNVLTVHYTESLVNQTDTSYLVDAWGYNITDLAGNKIAKDVSQIFKVTGVDTIAPTVTSVSNSGNTITYTFSEAMQLRTSAGEVVAAEDYASKLAVYAVTGGNYGLDTKATGVAITGAALDATGKILTITYTGSLVKQAETKYVVDAWGYRITDTSNNKMLPAESQIFTVAGDTTLPTATVVHDGAAKTITYTFSEPMQLVKQDTLAVTALTKELLGIYAIDDKGD